MHSKIISFAQEKAKRAIPAPPMLEFTAHITVAADGNVSLEVSGVPMDDETFPFPQVADALFKASLNTSVNGIEKTKNAELAVAGVMIRATGRVSALASTIHFGTKARREWLMEAAGKAPDSLAAAVAPPDAADAAD